MADLRDLHEQIILDHASHPRHFGDLPNANRFASGQNRVCGDSFSLFVNVRDECIESIAFTGRGCPISTASASLMAERVHGRPVVYARLLLEKFHDLLTLPPGQSPPADPDLGKLAALAHVRAYPLRIKCATLIWHALRAALDDTGPGTVSTE